MKRKIYFCMVSFLLFTNTVLLSQQKKITQTEEQIKTLLCRKWKCMYMEGNGHKMLMSAMKQENIMQFNTDQTFISKTTVAGHKSDDRGKWTFDYKSMTLTTDENNGNSDGMRKLKIIKITDGELLFATGDDKMKMNMMYNLVR